MSILLSTFDWRMNAGQQISRYLLCLKLIRLFSFNTLALVQQTFELNKQTIFWRKCCKQAHVSKRVFERVTKQ